MVTSAGLVPMQVTNPLQQGEFAAELAYSPGIWHMIEYSLAVGGLALFAGAAYSFMNRNEVSARYRSAVMASGLLQAVAAIAYLALFITWHTGFVFANGQYVPAPDARFAGGLRYADWSVTVPLLAIELLAVTAVVGKALSRARFLGVTSAFLMIITGFFGAQVFDNGTSTFWLNIWAAISTVFMIVFYYVGAKAVFDSKNSMSAEAHRTLVRAMILLFSLFGAYPLLYLVQVLVTPNSNLVAWAVVVQVGFSFSDIAAKVGFGYMIHHVAKVRTAEDVAKGDAVHEEPVWIAHEMRADARPATAVAMGTQRAGNGSGVTSQS